MKKTALLITLVLTISMTPGLAAADGPGNLLTTLPDWNDEQAAYQAQGLTIDPGLFEHVEGGNYNSNQLRLFRTAKCHYTSPDDSRCTGGSTGYRIHQLDDRSRRPLDRLSHVAAP